MRSWKNLLTLAIRARSFTDNSGRRYSRITSVGTSSSPVLVDSVDMVDIVSATSGCVIEPLLIDVNKGCVWYRVGAVKMTASADVSHLIHYQQLLSFHFFFLHT